MDVAVQAAAGYNQRGKAKRSAPFVARSALADLLEELHAWSVLSATLVQQISAAAVADDETCQHAKGSKKKWRPKNDGSGDFSMDGAAAARSTRSGSSASLQQAEGQLGEVLERLKDIQKQQAERHYDVMGLGQRKT